MEYQYCMLLNRDGLPRQRMRRSEMGGERDRDRVHMCVCVCVSECVYVKHLHAFLTNHE